MKNLFRNFGLFLAIAALLAVFSVAVSADTTVTSGPYTGCTVGANQVTSCPTGFPYGYNSLINNYYAQNGVPYYCVAAGAKDDSLPACGVNGIGYPVYGNTYGSVAPLQNVVAVYRDNRYCDGIVYITNEGGNLINRCDNGARVYPVYPDYAYYG